LSFVSNTFGDKCIEFEAILMQTALIDQGVSGL
jgi:hypothetical protein